MESAIPLPVSHGSAPDGSRSSAAQGVLSRSGDGPLQQQGPQEGEGNGFLQLLQRLEGEQSPNKESEGDSSPRMLLRLLAALLDLSSGEAGDLPPDLSPSETEQDASTNQIEQELRQLLADLSPEPGEEGQALLQLLAPSTPEGEGLQRPFSEISFGTGKGLSSGQMQLLQDLLQSRGISGKDRASQAGASSARETLQQLLQNHLQPQGASSKEGGSEATSARESLQQLLQNMRQGSSQDMLHNSQQNSVTEQGKRGNPSLAPQGREAEASAGLLQRLFSAVGDHREEGQRNAPLQQDGGRGLGLKDPLWQQLLQKGDFQSSQNNPKGNPGSQNSQSGSHSPTSNSAQWGFLSSAAQSGSGGTSSGSASLLQASQSVNQAQVSDSQVVQQVVTKLQSELQRGLSRITVNMHPPELGKVKLNLVSNNSGLQAQIQVQNPQVQQIMEKNMPALREALNQQGLDGDEIDVSVESEGRGDEFGPYQEREDRQFLSSGHGAEDSRQSERKRSNEDYSASLADASGINLRV